MKNKELLGICIFIICLFPLTLNAANYRAFSAKPFSENEVRFIFLGSSGVVLNSAAGAVVIDPATLLDDYDLDQLKTANVVLIVFTHSHGDHFDSGTAVKLFKATGAHILADAMVVGILEGKIPRDRLINGLNGKTYGFGKIAVDVIQGKHGSLINLYRITMDRVRVFHGG
ncbi:MAG: MBL fold metallo-hydrolase, partial [Proteobacteria bacterium]|nr:MBL fold metallo-hydrolase [Pseudomonadota bacterium]MBU1582707.1 MBL fold metallo-hydrolase [Pseudomonadota bacterium]